MSEKTPQSSFKQLQQQQQHTSFKKNWSKKIKKPVKQEVASEENRIRRLKKENKREIATARNRQKKKQKKELKAEQARVNNNAVSNDNETPPAQESKPNQKEKQVTENNKVNSNNNKTPAASNPQTIKSEANPKPIAKPISKPNPNPISNPNPKPKPNPKPNQTPATAPNTNSHKKKVIGKDNNNAPTANTSNNKDYYAIAEKLYLSKESSIKLKSGDNQNDFLIKNLAEKGTLQDRISSLCLLTENNKNMCIGNLNQLLEICNNKSKKTVLLALDALKNLLTKVLKEPLLNAVQFQTYLKNKKLTNPKDDEQLDAYLNHNLKMFLIKFNKVLDTNLKDPMLHFRKKAMDITCHQAKIFENLDNNIFLKCIVNKQGDSDEHIVQSLLKTLDIVINKNMSLAHQIQKEIQVLLTRKNQPKHARFMAQTLLANVDYSKVEDKRVCSISLTIFSKECQEYLVNYNEEENAKMLNQCLRGINRIVPHLTDKDEANKFIEENADYFFKLAHQAVPRIKIQILLFLYQILKHDLYSSQINRFYRVVYEMLLDSSIINSSLNEIFLELLYNCLKGDYMMERVHSFIKRLLQIGMHCDSNVVIAILMLLQKVSAAKEELSRYDVTGTGMRQQLNDDDDEVVNDVESDDDDDQKNSKPVAVKEVVTNDAGNSEPKEGLALKSNYDPFKREPMYSGAKNTVYYELLYFQEHYHPTVKKLAKAMMEDKTFSAKGLKIAGNPLLDFSNAGFINRLIMQKPRKKMLGRKSNMIKKGKIGRAEFEDPFSIKNVLENKGREDENYMKKYFENKVKKLDYMEKRAKKKDRNSKKEPDEVEEKEMDEFADELFERELKAVEGNGDGEDEDDDVDFGDYDDDEDMDDDMDEDMDEDDKDGEDDEGDDELNVDEFDEDMDIDDGDFDDLDDPEEDAEDLGNSFKPKGKGGKGGDGLLGKRGYQSNSNNRKNKNKKKVKR